MRSGRACAGARFRVRGQSARRQRERGGRPRGERACMRADAAQAPRRGTCIGVDDVQWISTCIASWKGVAHQGKQLCRMQALHLHTPTPHQQKQSPTSTEPVLVGTSPHIPQPQNASIPHPQLATRPQELPQHRTTPRQTCTCQRVEFTPAALPTSTSSRRRVWTHMDAWCVCVGGRGGASAALFTSPS